ncbi:MAG: FHA domain-containing protein [Saprospiraceae bacterium]|nr:FHA domain-containing protein [Saprospiraceae bacterium]
MNELQLSIGRDEQSDIVLKEHTISKHHAVLNIRYYDDITLEDTGSKNGTFINDRRIKKVKLHGDDIISFGDYKPDMKLFFQKIFDKFRTSKTDFHKEYAEMMKSFKDYQEKKDKLINQPKGPVIIRIGITLIVLCILVFYPQLVPNPNLRYLLMASAGMISLVGSVFTQSTAKRNEEMDKLRLKYEDKLVCPKCRIKLINNNYAYYDGRKRCINERCDAVYQK